MDTLNTLQKKFDMNSPKNLNSYESYGFHLTLLNL
jgi:hypothetical protein